MFTYGCNDGRGDQTLDQHAGPLWGLGGTQLGDLSQGKDVTDSLLLVHWGLWSRQQEIGTFFNFGYIITILLFITI